MIIRHIAPRQCRRLLFSHVARAQWTHRPFTSTTRASDELSTSASSITPSTALPPSSSSTSPTETLSDAVTTKDEAYLAQERLEAAHFSQLDAYHTWNHLIHNQHEKGSDVAPHYEPRNLLSDPPGPADITLELLMASQAHLGHSTSLWNPANSRYIFGIRAGVHVISLDATAAHLRRAAKVVSGVAERGGLILFAGTRKGQARPVVRAAELAAPAYHIFSRWIPGSITNGQQILGGAATQVVDELDRPVQGFDEQLLGRRALRPDLVVCLNPLENYVLLHECALANIPTIGVIDTDADPTWVTYPIPANDDSLRTITLIAGVLGRAGQEGQARRLEAARGGKMTFTPAKDLVMPIVEQSAAEDQEETETMGLNAPTQDDQFEEMLRKEEEAADRTSRRQDVAQENVDEQGPSVVR